MDQSEGESENVAGILRGRDPRLREEYVVISAHLDHLGIGAPINGDSIYHGAMDDAAGVASLFEIARALKASPPRRSVLLVAVTGEEKGLLGSKYFAAYPSVKSEAMVADLNLDMFLPLHSLRLLTVYGLEESSLGGDARAVARAFGVRVQTDPEPDRNVFIRSDQYSFIRAGVPSLLFKFGYGQGSPEERLQKEWLKTRYHAPSDDASQPVNPAAAAKFNRLMAALAARIANQAQRPQWNSSSFFRRFARGSF
jgi:Zn-dependent M28 family amino/carboxypeptidase